MSKKLDSHGKFFIICILCFLIFSCASRKEVVYFQDTQNYETIVSDNSYAYKFKVDDVLSINVSTLDAEASIPFNLVSPPLGQGQGFGQQQLIDYIVNKDGNIDFPVLGPVNILGLTPNETKELLKEKLKVYLKDPIINIRLRNFSVTILGEVNRPGTYIVNGEQITILEALGLAGDLNIKGKRENILVIRDFNGTKVSQRVDLTKKETLNSPVYYLTQNDVIYVEPNKSGITASSLDNRAGIAISIASLIITSTVIILSRN
ncbi:sugar transporter [Maribacter sp. 4U21]|uniref:polysaccharide biosynthesis/export family protein n=1 Tax=Maribacter sp. 4U21 TaxID=1889779 RepID=UPI000C1500DE|nr:polysaccharide biosynthesis/export family protein [Maribacter sp. 4U21]PIB25514.1 sugar transporter [Maribacter sp. 4U21]